MAKLVAVESGSIVPLPGTPEPSDGGGVAEGIVITEKTWLIIDGDEITFTDEHGYHRRGTYINHKLELDEKSNYKEKPLFFIEPVYTFAIHLQIFIGLCKSNLRIAFQTIFRKSHISDYGLNFLDKYIAKRILPKIKAYRKMYLEYGKLDKREPSSQEEMSDDEKLLADAMKETEKYMTEGEKAWYATIDNPEKTWLAVIDEVIFAMRWRLEVDMLNDTPENIAFYKEYYGQYIAWKEDEDKHHEQWDDAADRARRGFASFGRFFSDCCHEMTMRKYRKEI